MPIPKSAVSSLTGSERAFAAGADIKDMQARTYMEVFEMDLFAGWDEFRGRPDADHRGRCGLCARAVAANWR